MKINENKTMTMDQYKDYYNKQKEEEMSFYKRSTNIKCENCLEGIYHHIDSRIICTSNPPQQKVQCNNCDDINLIPC